jgi:DNA polymerase III sliding clamp (beta) subunit (PCNA family)
MILQTEKFQESCKKILDAVDSSTTSLVTETLELVTVGKTLFLNVTNREYYVSVSIPLDVEDSLDAVVDANLFLNLISKITAKDIELTADKSILTVKAGGTYKLPMIYDVDSLMVLPKIEITNPMKTFSINSDVLSSILNFNTKELSKGNIIKPVQRMYYIDEKGCLTFTSGACINSFTLAQPVKLLFSQKLVKLFKLFKPQEDVKFTLGQELVGDVTQTRVKFEGDGITITSILVSDDTLINSVPVDAIRGRGEKAYPYRISLNKASLISAIDRLLLFNTSALNKGYGIFSFSSTGVTIYDAKKENKEPIAYEAIKDGSAITPTVTPYECCLDLNNLKATLDGSIDQFVVLNFGDEQAIVLSNGSIKNIIPQVRLL